MEVFRPVELIQPSYMKTYEWEKFDLTGWRRWFGQHWSLTIYISVVYVALIFSTQFIMRNRKPFRLTGLLTAWNSGLAIFSTIVFLRTVPEFIHVLSAPNGFHNSVCHWWDYVPHLIQLIIVSLKLTNTYWVRTSHNTATAFWTWLFVLSKVIELGDTAFVVLRKQPLLFLHW
jgi:elongation of very long chain fatty acids protein 3